MCCGVQMRGGGLRIARHLAMRRSVAQAGLVEGGTVNGETLPSTLTFPQYTIEDMDVAVTIFGSN